MVNNVLFNWLSLLPSSILFSHYTIHSLKLLLETHKPSSQALIRFKFTMVFIGKPERDNMSIRITLLASTGQLGLQQVSV